MNVTVYGAECGSIGYNEFEKGMLLRDVMNNLLLVEVDATGAMRMIAFWHEWGWDWASYTTPDGISHTVNKL